MMSQLPSVLIVDDNIENLKILTEILRTNHYKVATVNSGEKAITFVKRKKPDLILMDIVMPGMDGYSTCGQLKSDPDTQNIPVIFISALSQTEDKVRAFQEGGVDYITKPFEVDEVIARVNTHLTIRNLQKRLEDKNKELEKALENVKTLSGLIPICASCKKIRNDQGYWQQVEVYIRDHSDAQFSHGICPECMNRLYPDMMEKE